MKLFERIFSTLLVLAAFCLADTTSIAPVDSAKTATDSVISQETKKHAVWIKLEGDVEPSMYDFCARAIDEALQEKPDYIIFEINTFGGRLDAAFDLVDTIMAVKGPTTIALVKKKAISAGSLIALACQKLYMLEATTIGDCAPIVQGGDGTPQIVGEKIQSPLRAKFRNLAQRNGYPEGKHAPRKPTSNKFKRQRTSISCSREVHALITAAAREAGVSVSSYFVRAAIEKVRSNKPDERKDHLRYEQASL